MKHYTCRDCGSEFSYDNSKAGRPPVRCDECRKLKQKEKENPTSPTRVKTSLSPIERVDRLEAMLKSRGLHPSQNPER